MERALSMSGTASVYRSCEPDCVAGSVQEQALGPTPKEHHQERPFKKAVHFWPLILSHTRPTRDRHSAFWRFSPGSPSTPPGFEASKHRKGVLRPRWHPESPAPARTRSPHPWFCPTECGGDKVNVVHNYCCRRKKAGRASIGWFGWCSPGFVIGIFGNREYEGSTFLLSLELERRRQTRWAWFLSRSGSRAELPTTQSSGAGFGATRAISIYDCPKDVCFFSIPPHPSVREHRNTVLEHFQQQVSPRTIGFVQQHSGGSWSPGSATTPLGCCASWPNLGAQGQGPSLVFSDTAWVVPPPRHTRPEIR